MTWFWAAIASFAFVVVIFANVVPAFKCWDHGGTPVAGIGHVVCTGRSP